MWWLCFAQKDINKVMRVYVHTYIRTSKHVMSVYIHTSMQAIHAVANTVPVLYIHDIHTYIIQCLEYVRMYVYLCMT